MLALAQGDEIKEPGLDLFLVRQLCQLWVVGGGEVELELGEVGELCQDPLRIIRHHHELNLVTAMNVKTRKSEEGFIINIIYRFKKLHSHCRENPSHCAFSPWQPGTRLPPRGSELGTQNHYFKMTTN